jgi:hypothetical protein
MEASINSAIKKGFFQQVRYKVEFGANLNLRDDDRRTPLMNCALIQDEVWAVGLARILIEKGARLDLKDKYSLTALHYACIFDKPRLAEVLCSAVDFDINAGDRHGNTPLHYAVSNGNIAVTRLLIETLLRYSLTVDKPNKKGVTPLMMAWKSGHFDCAKLLVTQGRANEDARDSVENKTAKDWEREATEKENRTNMPNQKGSGPKIRRERVRSAPLMRNRRPTEFVRKEMVDKENEEKATMVDRNMLTAKLFRLANQEDIRTKPEDLIKVNPIDFFRNTGSFPFAGSRSHRARKLSCRSSDSVTNWKTIMQKYYTEYDFQFTGSFREAAKPVPFRDIFDERPQSAISECPSDVFSISSRMTRMSFKMDAKSRRDLASAMRKRRPSSSMMNLVKSAVAEAASNADSSPKTARKNQKPAKESTRETGREDSSTDSSTTVASGSKPDRPKREKSASGPRRSESAPVGDQGHPETAATTSSDSRPQSRTGHYQAATYHNPAADKILSAIKE